MEQSFGESYKISKDKLVAIARVAEMDLQRVRAICTSPWPDHEVHQGWLDEAPVEEIAHWVRFVAKQEEEARD